MSHCRVGPGAINIPVREERDFIPQISINFAGAVASRVQLQQRALPEPLLVFFHTSNPTVFFNCSSFGLCEKSISAIEIGPLSSVRDCEGVSFFFSLFISLCILAGN